MPQLTFPTAGTDDLLSTDPIANYLKIRLTATDSQSLSKTKALKLRSKTVGVRFERR